MQSGLLCSWLAGPAAVQKAVANAIVAEITVALLKLFSWIKKTRTAASAPARRRGAPGGAGGGAPAFGLIVADMQHRPARGAIGAARRHFQLFRAET